MRREPYKTSSGLLTLAVHLLFFGMLYLGVNWRTEQPQGMQVELWGHLPQQQVMPAAAAPAPPPPQAERPRPAEPAKQAPPKAAIQMPAKKLKPEVKKPAPAPTPPQPQKMTKAQREQAQADMRAMEQMEDTDLASREIQDAQAARAAAAISSEQEKYMGLISAKIRRNIVMPPDVAANVEAEFLVTLLPDGSLVGDPRMVKSSGNAAYDAAVMRAILKSEPFPLPQEQAVRVRFINPNQIKLKFNSKDEQ
ncbi:MAG TPA: cell envelope integrity protein TolA [Gallionellaceae bacterium]|nr:cell envelope integrity protein TolA [Gallionellaceae bacterium]